MTTDFIERKIAIGAITSTRYLQQIRPSWSPRLMEADTARMLVGWCVDHFDLYSRAPGKDIEGVYIQKLRDGLDKETGEWIEDILESLSEQFTQEPPDVVFLIDQTKQYFKERHLSLTLEDAQHELDRGEIEGAEGLVSGYVPAVVEDSTTIDPFSEAVRGRVKAAFAEREKPLIRFPKALGAFWNQELVRGGFVAFMGREKVGKTFLLIELALRGVRSGYNIAFFQAGDMTEEQQLRRIAIHLAGRSDQDRYCSGMWVPVVDCLHHQLDECERDGREDTPERLFTHQNEMTYTRLLDVAAGHKNHRPCYNCSFHQGSPWLVWRPGTQSLTWAQAYRHLRGFGKKHKGRLRMSSHPNETLTVGQIKAFLSAWEKQEGFVADAVLIDYADILAPDPDFSRLDFRHQQNRTWQRLRNLSQERNCLVVTATQIKAAGFKKDLLSIDDFSEDKRKFAHVTAMYGLNQSIEEKRIGLLRINELVVREADFDSLRPVTILQRLQMGRPLLGSYR